jgi:hypothetical protein
MKHIKFIALSTLPLVFAFPSPSIADMQDIYVENEYLEHAPQLNTISGLPNSFQMQVFETTEEVCRDMLANRSTTYEVIGGSYTPVILKNGRQKTYIVEGREQKVVRCRIVITPANNR